MLVGRQEEIRRLEEALASDEAELIAIYGRGRVGKTYLVNGVYGPKIYFHHTALQPLPKEKKDEGVIKEEDKKKAQKERQRQLDTFYFNLLRFGANIKRKPKTWLEAFYHFQNLIDPIPNPEKGVIFLDEIPWMDTPKSGFLDAFIAFWNNYCTPRHLKLVVCGSSSSWILDKIIHNTGGLYHRATVKICLDPFNLREAEEYFHSKGFRYSRYDIARAYMALGGIPYYFSFFRSGLSVSQNIDLLFFVKKAELGGEFDELFSSQFTNFENYIRLVRFLGKRKRGYTISEIEQGVGISSGGTLSNMLKALQNGMFVQSYRPFGEKGKADHYRLVDHFCLFYLKQVEPIKLPRPNYWETHSFSPEVNASRGNAFELLCFNHIKQIKTKLLIAGYQTNESVFCEKGEGGGGQIDMLIERADNVINVCEAKFVNDVYSLTKIDHEGLIRRCNLVQGIAKRKYSLSPVMITTFGLADNEYRYDYPSVILLDDLFVN